MKYEISYNGVSSESVGVIVTDISPPVRALRKMDTIKVPGRDGVLHIDGGSYDAVKKTVGLCLDGLNQLDAVHEWLGGNGLLVCSTEPNRAYYAQHVDEVRWERIGKRLYKATAAFECAPYRYMHPAAADIVITAPGDVYNPGTVAAAPIIEVTGAGTVSISIGGEIFTLTGMSGTATLDCDAMIVYGDATAMSGGFPRIKTGLSSVGWTGSVSQVRIVPRWRYL